MSLKGNVSCPCLLPGPGAAAHIARPRHCLHTRRLLQHMEDLKRRKSDWQDRKADMWIWQFFHEILRHGAWRALSSKIVLCMLSRHFTQHQETCAHKRKLDLRVIAAITEAGYLWVMYPKAWHETIPRPNNILAFHTLKLELECEHVLAQCSSTLAPSWSEILNQVWPWELIQLRSCHVCEHADTTKIKGAWRLKSYITTCSPNRCICFPGSNSWKLNH